MNPRARAQPRLSTRSPVMGERRDGEGKNSGKEEARDEGPRISDTRAGVHEPRVRRCFKDTSTRETNARERERERERERRDESLNCSTC